MPAVGCEFGDKRLSTLMDDLELEIGREAFDSSTDVAESRWGGSGESAAALDCVGDCEREFELGDRRLLRELRIRSVGGHKRRQLWGSKWQTYNASNRHSAPTFWH